MTIRTKVSDGEDDLQGVESRPYGVTSQKPTLHPTKTVGKAVDKGKSKTNMTLNQPRKALSPGASNFRRPFSPKVYEHYLLTSVPHIMDCSHANETHFHVPPLFHACDPNVRSLGYGWKKCRVLAHWGPCCASILTEQECLLFKFLIKKNFTGTSTMIFRRLVDPLMYKFNRSIILNTAGRSVKKKIHNK